MVDAAVGQVITQNIFPNPVKTLWLRAPKISAKQAR